jgi:cytochrome c oxidase cbb3-type subunit 4
MDTYSILREFADSWVLVLMFTFFVGTILWAFRPGSSKLYEDVGTIPLRNETPDSQDGDLTPDTGEPMVRTRKKEGTSNV